MELRRNLGWDPQLDALSVGAELAAIKANTRRLIVWSVVAHLTLGVFLLVASGKVPLAQPPVPFEITEITWLEEEILPRPEKAPLDPAAVPREADEPVVVAEAAPESALEPEPVIPPARDNLAAMQERLASLRNDAAGRQQITSAAAPALRRPDPASLGAMVPHQVVPARRLNRAASRPTSAPMALSKSQPGVVEAAVPAATGHRGQAGPAPLQEVLPGVSLGGEITGRRLLNTVKPSYPEWAKRDGVEVTVQLYFTVLPDGSVMENILIERTSGFDDFDSRARSALRQWRFEGLPPGNGEQQWGRIEFNYQLRAAG